MKIDSLYKRLQLEPDTKPSEIRKAFLRQARRVHPDKQRENEQANEDFVMLKEAYDQLLVAKKATLGNSRIIVEQVALDKWNIFQQDKDIIYQTNCRCGGQVTVEQDELVSSDYLIPCDYCSVYIQLVPN